MTTPSDPYSRGNNRPFDEDDVLAPLTPASEPTAGSSTTSSSPEQAATHASDSNLPPIDSRVPERRSVFANTDPAFDVRTRTAEEATTASPEAPASSPITSGSITSPATAPSSREPRHHATLADAVGIAPDNSFEMPSGSVASPSAPRLGESTPILREPPQRTAAWDEALTTNEPLPPGRGWTHTGVLIASIFLVPFAWYLISDAGVRLALVENSPWTTGKLNLAAIGELIGGVGVVGLTWYLARLSSLGAIVTGILVTAFGLLPVVAPTFTRTSILEPLNRTIGEYNAFTGNVIDHLYLSLGSGRMMVYGAVILFTGLAVHATRRRWEKRGAIIARHELANNR